MGALLKIIGKKLHPDHFDVGWKIKPSAFFDKDEVNLRTKKRRGIDQLVFDISDDGNYFTDLKNQIKDTTRFLKRNYKHLKRISSNKNIDGIYIDFSFESKIDRIKVEIQNESFPAELIKLAGSLNIGIELMIWPVNSIRHKSKTPR